MNLFVYEIICIRKCGNDSKKELKGIVESQSKHINFEEFKKRLDGENCQKGCDDYSNRSIYHEMYLQEIKKINIIFM